MLCYFVSFGLSLAHCFRFLLLYCVSVYVRDCFFSANIYHLIISEWLRYWRTKPTKNGQHTFEQQQTFIPPQKCLSTLLTSKLFSLCFCFYFCCSNLCNFLWTIFIKGEVHSKLTKRRDYKWKYVDVKNVCGQLVFILAWKKVNVDNSQTVSAFHMIFVIINIPKAPKSQR